MNVKNINSSLPAYVQKYISKFGSDMGNLFIPFKKKYEMIIVVPAISEYGSIPILLNSLSQNNPEHFSKCLLLFVINNSVTADDKIVADNKMSMELLNAIISKDTTGKNNIVNDFINFGLDIAFIDASSEGNAFNEKDTGVGLARKTGMDAALTLFDYNKKKNILLCLDADCTVEKNYITEVYNSFTQKNISAAHIKFRHPITGSNDEKSAILCYEIFLRYYVLGLQYAKSHYAYHTVGSTIACDVKSYIKVGGMNKRQAAEDFYFLEKLAKIVGINYINGTTVYPSGRKSWRVPFGTGQRMNRFEEGMHDEYKLFNFETFVVLKKWIKIFHSSDIKTSDEYLIEAGKINPALMQFLEEANFKSSWDKITTETNSIAQLQKQKLLWFDAFKTLKLIHYLRDNLYPLENMFDELNQAFKYFNMSVPKDSNGIKIPTLKAQEEYLQLLRNLT